MTLEKTEYHVRVGHELSDYLGQLMHMSTRQHVEWEQKSNTDHVIQISISPPDAVYTLVYFSQPVVLLRVCG